MNGVVTSTVKLAKKLADRGHIIHIIAPKFEKKVRFNYPGIHVRRVVGIKAGFYEDFKLTPLLNPLLYNYIKRNNIDVFHFQTPMNLGFEAFLLARFFKKPLIGTFHTFFADKEYLKHCGLRSEVFERLAWTYATFFYNLPDVVTSPSRETKRELVRQGCRVPIKIISNGIGSQFDNSRSERVRKKYDRGGLMLVFVGRLAHEKNHFFLMDVMREIYEKDPSIVLLMVGDGPQKDEIKARAPKNVIFLGSIKHDAFVRSGILGACDVFCTASKTENQPVSIMEAQANGLACVGPRAKGISDLIKHKKNGLLVKPDSKRGFVNAILSLRDEKYRKQLSEGARVTIKEHDMDKVADCWEKVYKG